MSPHLTHAADTAVQRVADVSVWVIFRLNGVKTPRGREKPVR